MSCSVCAGYSGVSCPCCGEQARLRTCQDCNGRGHSGFFKFDILTRRDIEVDEAEYRMLPDTEDLADAMGLRFCKQELDICPVCDGEGFVYRY